MKRTPNLDMMNEWLGDHARGRSILPPGIYAEAFNAGGRGYVTVRGNAAAYGGTVPLLTVRLDGFDEERAAHEAIAVSVCSILRVREHLEMKRAWPAEGWDLFWRCRKHNMAMLDAGPKGYQFRSGVWVVRVDFPDLLMSFYKVVKGEPEYHSRYLMVDNPIEYILRSGWPGRKLWGREVARPGLRKGLL